jgi:hypothetical protein
MAIVEFRTGKIEIPDYMADLMVGIPTHKLTYRQAVDAMNAKMLGDHVNRQHDRIIDNHFHRRR